MAYKKKTNEQPHKESIFDVKGELTFWVKASQNGKLYASTSVKNKDGVRMFYSVSFSKEVDLSDFDDGMNKVDVKKGFFTCYETKQGVQAKIMVLEFE